MDDALFGAWRRVVDPVRHRRQRRFASPLEAGSAASAAEE
jgi:hypothetical protein